MPKRPPFNQQRRQAIGKHMNWQDKKEGSQQEQDKRAQRLARLPVLHTGNVHRQNATLVMVQLLSVLNTTQISNASPMSTQERAEEFQTKTGGMMR